MAKRISSTASTDGTEAPKTTKITAIIPKKDKDVSSVSSNVSAAWLADPSITLRWKTADEFKVETDFFIAHLADRDDAGVNRPEVTARLKVLDGMIDKGVKHIKNYLSEDFDDQDIAQHAKYGLENTNKGKYLPLDRNKRSTALDVLLKGIKDGGYNTRKYGKAYFEPLAAEYKELVKKAGNTDGKVSSLVGSKNLRRAEIEKTLKALVHIIIGNYPDTHKNVLRAWGFQKEKY